MNCGCFLQMLDLSLPFALKNLNILVVPLCLLILDSLFEVRELIDGSFQFVNNFHHIPTSVWKYHSPSKWIKMNLEKSILSLTTDLFLRIYFSRYINISPLYAGVQIIAKANLFRSMLTLDIEGKISPISTELPEAISAIFEASWDVLMRWYSFWFSEQITVAQRLLHTHFAFICKYSKYTLNNLDFVHLILEWENFFPLKKLG